MFTSLRVFVGGSTLELTGDDFDDEDVMPVLIEWFTRLPPVNGGDTAPVLAAIQHLEEVTMTKMDEVLAKLGGINTQTTSIGGSIANVAADIARVKEQLAGGLTASEADSVIEKLGTVESQLATAAEQLTAVASEFPEPQQPSE